MKLRSKIQLITTAAMLILLIIVNLAIYFVFRQVSVHHALDRLEEQARNLAETAATIDWQDTSRTSLFQADLPAEGMVRFISADGAASGTITRQQVYIQLPYTYETAEIQQTFREDDRWYAEISMPVIRDGTIYTMQVTEELATLAQTMQVLKYSLFSAALIILIPTIFGGRFLGSLLLKPILAVTNAMNEIRKSGKWKQIEFSSKSNDELQELIVTFNSMVAQLESTFEKQKQFVSDASHELKTPIAIIKSYSSLLNRWGAEDPDVQQESVRAIQAETNRMNKLVEQLLVLAREDATVLKLTEVQINKLVKECADSMRVAHDRAINVESKQLVTAEADEDLMKQVLYIILSNAIKYSSKPVKISIDSDQHAAVVRVIDHGEGIAVPDQMRIFERFYRVDKARTREKGGSGLGLAIAKQIMELHNGQLAVESELGQGSIFMISLPFHQPNKTF